jgi:glyoxylase-like metal-dependent hydrolase (beta-lactamase superfamily II)
MMKNCFANVKKIYNGMESKVTKYDWGKEVAPGITSVEAPGHTPGHTAFVVASGNSRILIQSDVTNIPEFFLRNPDWHVAYDVDPVQAQATGTSSTTWQRPRRRWWWASTSHSHPSAMWRRTARSIAWCPLHGIR